MAIQVRRRFGRRHFLKSTAGLLALPRGFAAAGFRFAHTKGEKVTVLYRERPVLEVRYDPTRPKVYVHPLYFPDGAPATLDSPPDHIHHRGVFLGWNNINGFDFWGENTPLPHGRVVHERFLQLRETTPATLASLNEWVGEGSLLAIEQRTLRVPPPIANVVRLDWESKLTAKAPLTLDASGHPYDGLGVRFPRSMDGGRCLNSQGTTEIGKASGQPAAWCAYSIERTGGGRGVAIFDHPNNPRHPTPFFVMNQPFGFLSAALTFRDPLRLGAGESLRLRYAVAAFLGKADGHNLDRLYTNWSGK
jgi:hypothetical protein